jgi:hypothetical protein
VGVTPPSVAISVWMWGALDPILIGIAVCLGWRADQAGKIWIAAIAALGISVLADWILTSLGVAWVAPVSSSGPMLLPVRALAGVAWAGAGYAARRVLRPG